MNTIKKIITLFLLISALSVNAYAEGERSGKKDRKVPPQAALSACEGLQAEQTCSFISRRHGDVSGTCVVPKSDTSALACKPERKSRK